MRPGSTWVWTIAAHPHEQYRVRVGSRDSLEERGSGSTCESKTISQNADKSAIRFLGKEFQR
jgi:hypothetical protein